MVDKLKEYLLNKTINKVRKNNNYGFLPNGEKSLFTLVFDTTDIYDIWVEPCPNDVCECQETWLEVPDTNFDSIRGETILDITELNIRKYTTYTLHLTNDKYFIMTLNKREYDYVEDFLPYIEVGIWSEPKIGLKTKAAIKK